MMNNSYIFAIDVGTSSLKAAIIDRELNILEHAQGKYSYKVVENMGVEIDPEDIWNAFVKQAYLFALMRRIVTTTRKSLQNPR